jgi:hypothetical protein
MRRLLVLHAGMITQLSVDLAETDRFAFVRAAYSSPVTFIPDDRR